MNEKQVINLIGQERYNDFLHFMRGQTVGINPDGSIDYYIYDIERFLGKRIV